LRYYKPQIVVLDPVMISKSGYPLLAPEAFCPLYVHWMCAQMDLALGETARAMNELQVYSDYLQEFAVWMRKRYAPAAGAQWRY
jgi:hypothetical protein